MTPEARETEARQVNAIAGLLLNAIKGGYLTVEEARLIVDGKAKLTDFMQSGG